MIRTLMLAAVLAGSASAQTPPADIGDTQIAAMGCEAAEFRRTQVRLHPFPEVREDTILAVCYWKKPFKRANGEPGLGPVQELVLVDAVTFAELARHDIGCCSRKILISLKTYPDEASNPVKPNPRAMSDALKALGVTRSANIYVDEDNGGTAHEFRIADGAWQRLFWH